MDVEVMKKADLEATLQFSTTPHPTEQVSEQSLK